MNNPEHEQDNDKPSGSLEGRGWDILAGGRENPFALGGDDPFDEEYQPSKNTFTDDDEADLILGVSTLPEAPPTPDEEIEVEEIEEIESNTIRAQGSEVEREVASSAEPEPRDLSPEDLMAAAASSSGPMGAVTPGVQVEVVGGYEEPAAAAPVEPVVEVDKVEEAEETPVMPTIPVEVEEIEEGPITPGVEVEEIGGYEEPVIPVPQPESETGGPITPPEEKDYSAPATTPPVSIEPEPDRPIQPPWPMPEVQSQSEFVIQDPWERSSSLSSRRPKDDPDLIPYPEYEKALITKERVNELWDEIDEAYDQVINDVRGDYSTTDDAIADLKEARELLLAGPEHFDNAEVLVKQVKARLRLEEKVRQWSKTWGAWLGTYLVVWLILLSISSFFTLQVDIVASEFVPNWMAATFLPGFFGGFGGVVGALWVLIKHTTRKRDFDPIHARWYIVNPFLGIALGVLTYLVIWGGGVVLGNLAGISGDFTLTASTETGASVALLYLLCAIVGFNQNVLWRLISRVMKAVFPEDESEEEAVTSAPDSAGEPVG